MLTQSIPFFTPLLGLFHPPLPLTSQTVPLPGRRHRLLPTTRGFTFLPFIQSFLPLRSSAQATCLSSIRPSVPKILIPLPTGPDKVAYPMLNHPSRSGMSFSFTSLIRPGLCIPFLLSTDLHLLFSSTR